jgi:heme/copper-type cytochrome/quinol oxidase subunit 2
MAAPQGMKPYVKLASTLVLIGTGLFSLEQYGLGRLEGDNHAVHLDGTILSLMVLVPIALVAIGAIIFVVGKMRRL